MIKLLLLYNSCYSTNNPINSAASSEFKLSNSFSYDYCYSTYSPTNYVVSPECLTNDQNPYNYRYSTYSPTNSAASPECLTNYPIPSLTALATLLKVLLTLLLPLNAFNK